MTRIPVNPELLTWARKCVELGMVALAGQPFTGMATPREGNP